MVTSTLSGGSHIVATYVPTIYTQFASISATITTSSVDQQGVTKTLIVGPSGVAWTPVNHLPDSLVIPYPSTLPRDALGPASSSSSTAAAFSGSIQSLGSVISPSSPGTGASTTSVPSYLSSTGFLNFVSHLESKISQSNADKAGSTEGTSLPASSNPSPSPSKDLLGLDLKPLIGNGKSLGSSAGSSSSAAGGSTGAVAQPSSNTATTESSAAKQTSGDDRSTSNTEVTNLPPETFAPPSGPGGSGPGITTGSSSSSINGPAPGSTTAAPQISVTDAFANSGIMETAITANGTPLQYSKTSFADLSTLTEYSTVTTPIPFTNEDGSSFTIPAAVVIVGPGGSWWNGGPGGFGLSGPSCIWPFCPPGGGGNVGGGSGGPPGAPAPPSAPNKPGKSKNDNPDNGGSKDDNPDNDDSKDDNPDDKNNSDEDKNPDDKPEDNPDDKPADNPEDGNPDDENDEEEQSTKSQEQPSTQSSPSPTTSISSSSSSSSSSCSASITMSDCSVICSATTSVSTQTCSTTCFSTMTGCSATGTTVYSTATAKPCTKLTGWGEVEDGEDFEPNQSFVSAGIVQPSSSSSGFRLPSLPFASSYPTGGSGSSTGESASSAIGSARASSTSSVPRPSLIPLSVPLSSSDPPSATSSASASTTTAPLDVPGVNGVPGCTTVVSAPGTSAHCQCGDSLAPLLEGTKPGFSHCGYTIQPTSSYDPVIPKTESLPSEPPPPVETKCNVHIVQKVGTELKDPAVVLSVEVTDKATSQIFGTASADLDWDEPLDVDTKIGQLSVTPQPGGLHDKRGALRGRAIPPAPLKPHLILKKGPIKFSVGSQEWDSTSSQCSVGDWDSGDAKDFFEDVALGDTVTSVRQADCEFDCSIPNEKKRTLAVPFGDVDHQLWSPAAKTPSWTRDRLPSSVEENLLQIRAKHSKAWDRYWEKGVQYYKEWQDKTGNDVVLPCDFESYFDIRYNRLREPRSYIRDLLTQEGFNTEREYYATNVVCPKDAPIADFTNTVSGTAGVFLANANTRGDTAQGIEPVPCHFSTVAWWLWKKALLSAHPEWVQAEEKTKGEDKTEGQETNQDTSKADYSGIKAFFRRNIDNAETSEILDEVFEGQPENKVLKWTPDDPDDPSKDNAFWPLLGSPNGNGVQHFATDNKVALKGKGIVMIKAAIIDHSYQMWMLFEQ